jgi:hypothetical protein
MMAQSGQAHQSKDQSWSSNPATVYALTGSSTSCQVVLHSFGPGPRSLSLGEFCPVCNMYCTVLSMQTSTVASAGQVQ